MTAPSHLPFQQPPDGDGQRLRLRPQVEADADTVAPWLPEAVAAMLGRGAAPRAGLTLSTLLHEWNVVYPAGQTLIGETATGEPAGLLRARAPVDGQLVIDALTVNARVRNLGYGQEMVMAVERESGVGIVRILAGVPPTNGLAVYFWLRAGFHPLYPRVTAESSGLDPALLWMVRDLE